MVLSLEQLPYTPADFISLKLGINVVNGDSMRERSFIPAVHNFLDTIREKKPNTPILIISPIICTIPRSKSRSHTHW